MKDTNLKSIVINFIIFLALALIFFPLAVLFLIYKLYKRSKRNSVPTNVDSEINQVSHSNRGLAVSNNRIFPSLHIPEPTKSLLWVTDEDTSKISSPLQIRIEIKMGKNGVEADTIDDSYNFYSEPSLIWTRLPIQPNNDLETKKMYYPIYTGLSPIHRYQYLRWLTDISQDTNLSYVFLYYYGLERHLLIGNYDLAVDEILRLVKYHDKGTFKGYAVNALILGSGYRKRPDIIEKAPFILDEVSPVSLYLQRMAGKSITAQNIISMANRVGFSNKRYINQYPDVFEQELQKLLDKYQQDHGDILKSVDTSSSKEEGWASMANVSIPDNIRTIKFPSLLDSSELKNILKALLSETHLKIKGMKANKQIVH